MDNELREKLDKLIEQNNAYLEDNKQLREQIWLLLAELRRQVSKNIAKPVNGRNVAEQR